MTDSYHVENVPLDLVDGPMADHLRAALWLWQGRRGRDECPAACDLRPNDLEVSGAAGHFHIFDVAADDPLGYYLRHWSRIGNLAANWEVLGVPLGAWPFPVQAVSHAESLMACAEARRPILSRVDRVLAGLPQSYTRLLCPLHDGRKHVSRIASVVALDDCRIAPRLVDQSAAVQQQ